MCVCVCVCVCARARVWGGCTCGCGCVRRMVPPDMILCLINTLIITVGGVNPSCYFDILSRPNITVTVDLALKKAFFPHTYSRYSRSTKYHLILTDLTAL